MERMTADIGPLLELGQDILAFYQTIANKRQQIRAENGGQDLYNPSIEELHIHLKTHVDLMQKLLRNNPDLVSAYQLCDKHLATIIDAHEAEKANQQMQVQYANKDRAATMPPSFASKSGQNVDLNGMTMSVGPRPPPVSAGSPSIEETGSPAKKVQTQTPLSAVGTETLQERMHGRAFQGQPGPWRA